MTTTASTTSKNGKAKTTVKNEVKKKLTQSAIGLQVQELSIGRIIPDPMQPRKSFNEDGLATKSRTLFLRPMLHF